MDKLIGFVITASHLDIEWYQPLNSYRFWTVQALTDLKEAAKRDDFPCYVLDGQVFPLIEHLSMMPEDEADMRRLIKEGKLRIGPFYTQFDEWLPSAENMIRNCLYGKREAGRFGGRMCAGYLPDNFGHPRQLPQILNGFGIDSLLFMRGMPEVPGGHPDEFIYEGLDGSKVLCSHFRDTYAGAFDIFSKPIAPVQPRLSPYYPDYLSYEYHRELAVHDDPERIARNMVANVRRIAGRYPSRVVPLIAGFDHLPLQINVGESIAAANAMQDDIEFIAGDVEAYIRLVQSRGAAHPTYSMELVGSRYQYVLLGALSTRTYLKRQNFGCEALLEKYLEPLTAIARLHGFREPAHLLEEAWTKMLICSAHDSIHGSSVDEVHVEMEARFAQVRQIASGLIHAEMAYLSSLLAPARRRSVLVFPPISSKTPQPAEVWLAIGDEKVVMTNADGLAMPTQVLPREVPELNSIGLPRNDLFPMPVFRRVLFMTDGCEDLRRYEAVPAGEPEKADPLAPVCDESGLENQFVRVTVRGALIDLTDKRTGKTWHSLNLLEDEADAGDAWDFAPSWTPGALIRSSCFPFTRRVVENGPVRATLRLEGAMQVPAGLIGDERSAELVKLPVRFDISLCRGLPRVDVKLTLDNTACDHRIRLKLNMGVRTEEILSQGHLAVMRRSVQRQKEIEPWSQPPTQLLPCREWLAACDGKTGLAVAMKGLYDYEAAMDPMTTTPDVAVTLLRGFEFMTRTNNRTRMGAAAWAHHTPGAQCKGEHVIEWCYLPYQADEGDVAPFLPEAQAFLYPPLTHALRIEGTSSGGDAIACPVSWDEKNVQFSAFKRAEDGDGFILRLYENQGRPVTCALRLNGFTRAALCRMDETLLEDAAIRDGRLQVSFGAYKAVTIRFWE